MAVNEMESNPLGNGNGKPNDHRKTLAQIQADPRAKAGGAYALRRLYLADGLHRGCALWLQEVAPKHQEWAEYLGYETFEALPIGSREFIRSWIAEDLFVKFYDPSSDGGLKELRAALNSRARITRELMHMKREKKVDLPAAFAEMGR